MLSDSMLEIAEDMEAEAEDLQNEDKSGYTRMTLKGFAKQIRRAVKAAEGSTPAAVPGIIPGFMPAGQPLIPAEAQNRLAIEAAKAEFKGKVHRIGDVEEMLDGVTVTLVGGPDDGDMTQIATDVPHGAKVPLSGHVYIHNKEEKTLIYSELETKKIKKRMEAEQKAKNKPGIVLP